MDKESEYPYKLESISIPFTRVDTNVYENSPNAIQQSHSIIRTNFETNREVSNSSNDEFYEASPVLEEALYFPSLLEESNYPTVTVKVEPHMTKPLVNGPLDLLGIINTSSTSKPRVFPLATEIENKDELTLLRVMEYEMDDAIQKNATGWFSWFFPKDTWRDLLINGGDSDEELETSTEFAQNEVYLDQIFTQIYNL